MERLRTRLAQNLATDLLLLLNVKDALFAAMASPHCRRSLLRSMAW